jgi:hypothetical protein
VNVRTEYVSFGIDPETGYHDEAAIFKCSGCGATGESEELVYCPAIAAQLARKQAARQTRIAARPEVA